MSAATTAELAVDIVICNHNYGEFLGEAVESALAQTHPDVNVIVVDDGSTDDSRERLAAYADRVDLVLKENGGQASALNAGMERARGDVVIFLDADDTLRPRIAASAAHAIAADPRLAKVQFRMIFVDAAGRPTGATKPPAHLAAPTGDLRAAELAYPYDLPWLPGGGTAFRADALRSIFPIPEQDYPRYGADWYVVHLSALLGPAGWEDEVCADYRVHGRNGYELQEARLDLPHLQNSIVYARATTQALERKADELGLQRPRQILSVADLANRLLSLRLDPERHPLPGDSRLALVADGLRATRRRSDVAWPMKLAFAGWFLAAAIAPRPLLRRLGELLLFPASRRGSVNRLLKRLQRGSA